MTSFREWLESHNANNARVYVADRKAREQTHEERQKNLRFIRYESHIDPLMPTVTFQLTCVEHNLKVSVRQPERMLTRYEDVAPHPADVFEEDAFAIADMNALDEVGDNREKREHNEQVDRFELYLREELRMHIRSFDHSCLCLQQWDYRNARPTKR